MNSAVFIDRDGVINKDLGKYVTCPEEFDFLPRAIDALKRLYKSKYKLIIITDQGGIGKGIYTEKDLEDIHKKMCTLLENEGVILDGIYYCPHHPDENCDCRKPRLGMVRRAVEEHDINPKKSSTRAQKGNPYAPAELAADGTANSAKGAASTVASTGSKGAAKADKKFTKWKNIAQVKAADLWFNGA